MPIDALIPARGGSKRLYRKNLLELPNGKTLLQNAIDTVRRAGVDDIYVSSEDKEILQHAEMYGATPLERPKELSFDEATVDQVVEHFLGTGSANRTLVYQPCVVTDGLGAFLEATKSWTLDAVAGAKHVHGIWEKRLSALSPRTNTQQQDAEGGPFQEVGIRVYPAGVTSGKVSAVVPYMGKVIDIDTPLDLVTAQAMVNRRTVLFRVRYDKLVGSGHLRRTTQLALALQHHHVIFDVQGDVPDYMPFQNIDTFEPEPQPYPHMIINDVLDTSTEEMIELRYLYGSIPMINFEDHGPGAPLADHVVNALYPAKGLDNELTGPDWVVLRAEFNHHQGRPLQQNREFIGVSFGGTDPSDLTARVRNLLSRSLPLRYVTPPGAVYYNIPDSESWTGSMGDLFARSKFIITSAGRTLYEAARSGTPAIVIAQNEREATHVHLGPDYGNHYLGISSLVPNEVISHAVQSLYLDEGLQKDMGWRAVNSIDGKGTRRVLNLIEGALV